MLAYLIKTAVFENPLLQELPLLGKLFASPEGCTSLRLSHLTPVTATDDRSLSAWYTKISGEGKINSCLLEKEFWELWEKTTILQQYSTETMFLQYNQKHIHKIHENKFRSIQNACHCMHLFCIFHCSCYITSHSMQEAVLLSRPNYCMDNTLSTFHSAAHKSLPHLFYSALKPWESKREESVKKLEVSTV